MYRKADFTDCERIYRLVCELECREFDFDKFTSIFMNQLNSKNYFCLICEQNDNIIGFLNLRFEEQLHHCEYIAEIMEFIIDSKYRSSGVGKELFEKACQTAKEFGCSQIEVACNQLRTDTHRFYLREGMCNYHFKFSKSLIGNDAEENKIGK